MTKRILAIVLAVVMAMSLFAVEAFADNTAMTISAAVSSGTTINVSWSAVPDAQTYDVEIRSNNTIVGQRTGLAKTATSVSITTNSYGDHVVNVVAKNANGGIAGSGSTTVNVPVSSSNGGITVTSSGSGSCTASWAAVTGVSTYYVSWTSTVASNSGNTTTSGTSCTISAAYNTLTNVTVRLGTASGQILADWSNYGGGSGSGSTSTGSVWVSGTTLYWASVSGHYYSVTVTGSENRSLSYLIANSSTYSLPFDGLVNSQYTRLTFNVYDDTARTSVGSATYGYSGTGTGTGTGGVYVSGTTLYWSNAGYSYYYVTAVCNGRTIVSNQRVTTTYFSFSSYLSSYLVSGYPITFTVYSSYNTLIGTATYYPTNYNYGSGGVYVSGTTLYWSGSVQTYYVSATCNGRTILSRTSVGQVTSVNIANLVAQTYLYGNYPIYFTVYSYSGTIGSATYYPGGYSSSGTGTNYNYNLRVSATAFSVDVSWDTVPYASTYRVNYRSLASGSSNRSVDTPFTSVSLDRPSDGLYVEVTYYSNGRYYSIGSATVSANGAINYSGTSSNTGSSNTGSTQSGNYVSGVGCTMTVGSKSTTVSWNDYYGATNYQLIYTNVATNQSISVRGIYATSYTFPLGYDNTTGGIEVDIIAYNSTGAMGAGPFAYANYKPTTTNNNNTTTKPADTTPDAPTSFKATASNKQVLLSWNAAKNSTSYKVYWKRSSNSTWKLAKETTKRALTIKGLNNDMNYDFKVVASTGVESSVIKIAPTSSGSNTKTADDPKGSTSSSSSKNPVITSATGGNGTFTVSWNGVSGANSYKVYAHRVGVDVTSDGKQTYYCKATVSGTSATVSNLAAGTYQIRIKASTDGGNTWTSLSACDYYTVTVS